MRMKFDDFKIGEHFYTLTGKWFCTDKGTRVVVAIKVDDVKTPEDLTGPPYSIQEFVFDEYDFGGCSLKPFK